MLELQPTPLRSRDQRIRDEFALVGPMSTRRFTRHCINIGIWSLEEIAGFAVTTAQAKIRVALKAPDIMGLPFAGPTTHRDEDEDEEGDGEQVESSGKQWAQRDFWGYEDYALNIRELVTQRDTLHFNATDLASECRERFGRVPLIVDPIRQDRHTRGVAD